MKKIRNAISRSPTWVAALVLAVISVVVVATSFPLYGAGFWQGVLVEAHGLLLELLVLGVLLVYLDQRRSRLVRCERFQNEIDDFRLWHSEEASFRIRGNVLRLAEEGVESIDVARCNLKRMNFRNARLKGLRGQQVDLGQAVLRGACLSDADLDTAYMGYTDMRGVDLRDAKLLRTRFRSSILRSADLRGADARRTKFEYADLGDANFIGADVRDAVFRGSVLKKANLRGAKNLTAVQLQEARTLHEADLPDDIRRTIQEKSPHLLEEFSGEEYERLLVGPEAFEA